MATKNFKGFSLVKKATFEGAEFKIDPDTLYFVRAEGNLNDGFLYFNGKKYGTGVDAGASAKDAAIAAIKEYYGEELNGTHISEYIETKLQTITNDATALTNRVDALEETVGDAESGLVKSVVDNATAIKTNTDAIAKLNGKAEDEGSVAKTVADAVKTEKERAEEVEQGLRTDVDSKVASVSGKEAIVTGGTATAPEISLKIAETQGNVVLEQSTDGLKASIDLSAFGVKDVAENDKVLAVAKETGLLSSKLSLTYDSAAKKIYLYGQDTSAGNQISEIDAAAFVKDGMLESASLVTATAEAPINKKESGEFIKLTWNTDAGKEAMYIDVTSLVDVYTSADASKGLVLNDHAFSLDYTVVAKQTDITAAKNAVIGEGGTAKTIAAVEKALNDFTAKTEADAVTLVINDDDKYLSVSKAADENKYTIASKATKIDKSIKDAADAVKVSVTNGTYISGAVDGAGRVITLSETVQAVANASTTAKGLAEASDVKSYVDSKVSTNTVGATGETGDNALITATAGKNGVSVASTEKLKDAVAAAETAVQNAEGDTLVSASAADNKVTVSATEALTSAVAKANSAVQSVNGKKGTDVELKDADIKIDTLTEAPATADTVNKVLADIYSKIGLVKVSSTNKTITVDNTGRIVDVNTETVANAQAKGHVALEHGADGALYGVMYYSGDDAE